jgi:peptidoglycan/xylan/chitin deacetylase (PgdA/CDA1 family)
MRRYANVTLGVGLLAVYIGLPYLLAQRLGLGLVREGRQARQEVALTFDDGPDPTVTPLVLAALSEARAPATFVVLPAQAEAHPELIRAMLAAGHDVQPHGDRHRHAWLRSPWGAALDPLRAARRVSAVTGRPARYQRPPHGGYTLGTLWGQRRAGVTGLHWSVTAADWDARATPQTVRDDLNRKLHPGAIIALHDAGPGAGNTLGALPSFLADLAARGYRVVPLDNLDGLKPGDWDSVPRRIMKLLDRVSDRIFGGREATGRADSIWRIGRLLFPLRGVVLADGTPVPHGTPGIDFHANNPRLTDLRSRGFLPHAEQGMREVAAAWNHWPELQDVQVIFAQGAITRLLETLGFETQPLPPLTERRLRAWANVLRWSFHSPVKAPPPRLSIMGKAAFMGRYGPDAPECRDFQ